MSKIKKKSKKQESKVAKEIGGKVTIASGALYFQKADIRSEEFLIEAKTTEKSFYSLNIQIWNKIEKEALRDNLRTPLMHIQTNDGKQQFVVMSYNTFLALELDNLNYVGQGNEPILTSNKSFRIREDILPKIKDLDLSNSEIFYPRQDVKFVDHNKHLVILDWEDFLMLKDFK